MDTDTVQAARGAIVEALGVLRLVYNGELVERTVLDEVGKHLFVMDVVLEQAIANELSRNSDTKRKKPIGGVQMGGETPKRSKQPSAELEELAALFLSVSESPFLKLPKLNSAYISLDVQVGASKNNKNAVSISNKWVSFMVPDWSAEQEANSLGIETDRDEARRKLRLLNLTTSIIRENVSFFQRLLAAAKEDSIKRQSK